MTGTAGEAGTEVPKKTKGPRHARRRRRRGWWVALAVFVAVLAAAGGVGAAAAAEGVPAPTYRTLVPASVAVGGPASPIPWPSGGSAALEMADGIPLGTSGPSTPSPIASVTKVMTAYVVLHDHPLTAGQQGPTLTVSPADAAGLPARLQAGQSVLMVTAGETLTEYQALEALLIPSADNIADLLAGFDAGGSPQFVAKMNATAASLGMTHTHYADPSGLDPASASSAADQVILARAALADPVFASIVDMPSATFPGVGKVANYNSLVGHDGFTGIKTGSTNAAGGCLVFSVTRPVDGHPVTLIGAVLGQRHGGYITAGLQAASKLADGAFGTLHERVVVPARTPALVITRAGQHVDAETAAPVTAIAPPGTRVDLTLDRGTARPVAGAQVAVLHARVGQTATSVPVTATGTLRPPTFSWRLSQVL